MTKTRRPELRVALFLMGALAVALLWYGVPATPDRDPVLQRPEAAPPAGAARSTAPVATVTTVPFQREELREGPGDIRRVRATTLHGIAIDHRDDPVPGVEVVVFDGLRADLRPDAEVGRAITAADGRFRVELERGGVVHVMARKHGHVAASKDEDGTMSHVVRTVAEGSKHLDLLVYPILVSAVGIVNASGMPDAEVANLCAFARETPAALGELTPVMRTLELEAREHAAQTGRAFAHLGTWVGRPLPGGEVPPSMPVRVSFVDGSSVLVDARIVPLAALTIADIASVTFGVAVPTGQLDLNVTHPTTVTLLQNGAPSVWQRTLQPFAGRTRITLPAGRHVIMPSPATLLDGNRRRTEVEVPAGGIAVVPDRQAGDVAHLRVAVVDANGPVDLDSLQVHVSSAGGTLSLRNVAEQEIHVFTEPGPCSIRVRDAAGRLRGRLAFHATAGATESILVPIE